MSMFTEMVAEQHLKDKLTLLHELMGQIDCQYARSVIYSKIQELEEELNNE